MGSMTMLRKSNRKPGSGKRGKVAVCGSILRLKWTRSRISPVDFRHRDWIAKRDRHVSRNCMVIARRESLAGSWTEIPVLRYAIVTAEEISGQIEAAQLEKSGSHNRGMFVKIPWRGENRASRRQQPSGTEVDCGDSSSRCGNSRIRSCAMARQ